MKNIEMIAFILVIIGGINWGLVGLFNFDLIASIFGGTTALFSKIIYILIGISAIYSIKRILADK